jgi:cytochrome c
MIELPEKVARRRYPLAERHDLGIVIRQRPRSAWIAALLAGLLIATVPARADETLARERACLSCHSIERKLVGPAFRDVAKRYAGDREAEDRLAKKIRTGGAGAWGTLAMAPNPAVTEAEARRLARWVLSQDSSRQP